MNSTRVGLTRLVIRWAYPNFLRIGSSELRRQYSEPAMRLLSHTLARQALRLRHLMLHLSNRRRLRCQVERLTGLHHSIDCSEYFIHRQRFEVLGLAGVLQNVVQ